mmetsp:Transcript_42143/g.47907  ORF Transcript_42143/g.47907 Transcript_42143/m.47907 type:complete len:129 (-) Transcript_42143:70-456(-)
MEKELCSLSSLSCSPSRKSPARNNTTGEQNPNSKTRTSGFNSNDNNNTLSAQASTLIISESGNSQYMQQQRRHDEKVNQKVRQLQIGLQEASPEDYRVTEELDEVLRSYQQQQPIRATRVVVDMVCFY